MELGDLQAILASHPGLVCFAGAFLGGTSVTLFLATLAGQGMLPGWTVFVYASAGNLASDCLWYAVGRSRWAEGLARWRTVAHGYERVHGLASRYHRRQPVLFVLLKFVYGVRVLGILYFGRAAVPVRRFVTYDGVAVLVINGVVVLSGWMVGRGVGLFLDVFRNVRTAVTFAVVLFVAYHALRGGIRRWRRHAGDG